MHKHKVLLFVLYSVVLSSTMAKAEDYVLSHKNHQFTPQELVIPVHQKVKLTVQNFDSVPIEFESYELNREKVVAPQGQAVIYIGPLETGTYPYFDDFHAKETKGVIRAQ